LRVIFLSTCGQEGGRALSPAAGHDGYLQPCGAFGCGRNQETLASGNKQLAQYPSQFHYSELGGLGWICPTLEMAIRTGGLIPPVYRRSLKCLSKRQVTDRFLMTGTARLSIWNGKSHPTTVVVVAARLVVCHSPMGQGGYWGRP
jgi:hypothetical protein